MVTPSAAEEPRLRPADRWRQAVQAWLVPKAILDEAPEPVALEPDRFRWRPEEDASQPVRPSRRRALEALPSRGSVLDIGVGGGASSLGLVPQAALITGVDPLPGMLESFAASARAAGVEARAVCGRWPDAAARVEPADVVVCHHAIYGEPEIEPFLAALTASARHRVVIEIGAHPPLIGLNPLFRAFHGIERRDHPVADEAEAVLASMGVAVERKDIVLAAGAPEVSPERTAFVRRRLCLGPEHDAEITEFLRELAPTEQQVAALWWPGGA